MTVVLRAATAADTALLIKLEQSVAGAHVYSAMLEPHEWEKVFAQGRVYLICVEGSVAGSVYYEWRNAGAYLAGLVVQPVFQRQGLARTALELILEELRDVPLIELVTHPENTRALSLYLSVGFVVVERHENYYGDGEPRLVLRKVQQ